MGVLLGHILQMADKGLLMKYILDATINLMEVHVGETKTKGGFKAALARR